MTTKAETALREAATNFALALADAKAAGLAVQWPRTAEGLAALTISQTAPVKARGALSGAPVPPPPEEKPVRPKRPVAEVEAK